MGDSAEDDEGGEVSGLKMSLMADTLLRMVRVRRILVGRAVYCRKILQKSLLAEIEFQFF